jgi:hypothetical protein
MTASPWQVTETLVAAFAPGPVPSPWMTCNGSTSVGACSDLPNLLLQVAQQLMRASSSTISTSGKEIPLARRQNDPAARLRVSRGPSRVLRELVVGDHVGALLDRRKVREAQHRDLLETKQLRRSNTTMARKQPRRRRPSLRTHQHLQYQLVLKFSRMQMNVCVLR